MLSNRLTLSKARPIILAIFCVFSFIDKTAAQCNSQIGELQVLNFQHEDGLFICHNDTLKVEVEGFELMDSQQLFYVYHEAENVLEGTIIKVDTMETDGFMNNERYPFNVDFYVTATLAKPNLFLLDSCAVFSNTIKFTFLEPILIEAEVDCANGYRKPYDINLNIAGGLPALDSMYNYTTTGDYVSFSLNSNEIKISDWSDYSIAIYVFDKNGCEYALSKFTDCNFLPIELISFIGTVVENGHLLEWASAIEINNDYYLLELSRNGVNFEVLDTIDGAGTTVQVTTYSFLNEVNFAGHYIYRLSEVDFRGLISVVGYVEVISPAAPYIFPNPTHSILNFHHQNSLTNLRINIFDLSGKILIPSNKSQVQFSSYGFSIDVSSLPDGMYFAKILSDELERVEKFVVKK